jgi:signal transduction histidine kinase
MTGAVMIAASAVSFGLIANSLRRHYRHTSEARRLVLQFCALAAPILAAYPLAAASADRTARDVIEREYGPATQAAQQPEMLMRILTSAWSDIDGLTDLPAMLRQAGGAANSSQVAFQAWSRTVLSRERVTSQIELYGPTGAMVSRFSLNVPEFGSFERSSQQMWPGSGCEWDAFAGGARFGADERRMLYSERGLCGPGGEFLGAVVIRIIPDYRTLPFVTSANPYYDALGRNDPSRAGSRVPELQVVVYGWSLQPIFVSGRMIWPLDAELSDRLYRSRDSFWIDQPVDGRTYHLYFLNDRGGIYALGYPEPTPLQHATRLSESAALLVLLFVLYLGITVVAAPLARRGMPPLGRLFAEIRASFYRKLFLFFVVAAVGPVVLFAVAFGTYMTAKLRADVESEAGSVVLMARRVLDELSAAQAPAGQTRLAPNDDDMVLIRQVVDQDVNLFEGPELRATSQRDLFDSGLLPTRTPALVYRHVALDRRPVYVVEDRIGTFSYLVAAAPVTWLSREALLTVPLASRQREIERQIDELTRGVLTGAVVLVLFAAALGASVAARVSDPVARLTRATRLIAAGRFDEHLAADTADELGRLVQDFNTMTEMLVAQRAELARANQLKAWAEMARQVAHEIKNPLTPIQLAAEHLQRVHEDASRPLGPVVDSCLRTILKQVRLLRQIASEFSTFAGTPTPRIETVSIAALIDAVVEPYRTSLPAHTRVATDLERGLPEIQSDRTLLSRALTNLVENAFQAMPNGGSLAVSAARAGDAIEIHIADTGVGMDEEGVRRAFEPYFSTKTAGSGLGLANARRNIEICGGTIALASRPGRGTTVTVSLPRARPAGPAPEPPASPRTPTADTRTP